MADLYQNEDSSDTVQGKPDSESPDKSEMTGETTLVPKSMFNGKVPEPGDTCHFKVVHEYDDEIELKWVDNAKEEKEEGESEMDRAGKRIEEKYGSGSEGGQEA